MAARLLTQQVVGVSFAFYTDEEIRKLSVKAITNPQTFDANNLPMDGGLYDKALGPTAHLQLCPSCGLNFQECPGHMGHVELCVPVYNPTLFPLLYRLLRLKCYACHRLRMPASFSKLLAVRLILLDCGRLADAMELKSKVEALSSVPSGEEDMEEGDQAERAVARQAKYLDDLELDCIAQAGEDVGCGLGADGGPGRYSAQIRSFRQVCVDEYLVSAPPKACANCGALALAIRKDGYSKLFQKPLTRTAAYNMMAKGVRYTSATAVLRARARVSMRRAQRKEAREAAKAAATPGHAAKLGKGGEEEREADEDEDGIYDADALDEEDMFGTGDAGAAPGSDEEESGDSDPAAKPRYMPASEVAAQMELTWQLEAETLRRTFLPVRSNGVLARAGVKLSSSAMGTGVSGSVGYGAASGWRHFFLRVIPVPSARFRPPTQLGDDQYEHPQNVYLSKIMKLNDTLVDLGLGSRSTAAEDTNAEVKPIDLRRAIVTWMELQNNVNGLLDSSKASRSNGAEPANGIRQLLEKKAGLFRQNMMGKRVNYAARTVISPDPFLRTDQVGVPLRFAKRLHFKQPVNELNVEEMRRLVVNGAHVWPGATHVEDEFGTIIDLTKLKKEKREELAKKLLTPVLMKTESELMGPANALTSGFSVSGGAHGLSSSVLTLGDLDPGRAAAAAAAGALKGVGVKRVYRHLMDGDIVLMNRQPTLHKPSIMAHRARVMKAWPLQQILRFHYANCKTFNADFDGDEMNMHFIQDELARAEAYCIAAAPYQYLSATGGGPLRGLIQDHNSVAVLMTRRDHLLTRDQYCQLVFAGLQALPHFSVGAGGASADGIGLDSSRKSGSGPAVFDVPMLPPAVLKPQALWTGKQVVSALLKGLTAHLPTPNARLLHYDGKSKIGEGLWGEAKGRKDVIAVGESTVLVRGNELLTGVLDKSALGNSSYGLIHAVYEVHGPHAAAALLSSFGRLLTVFLQWSSMTCGIEDLMLDSKADAERVRIVNEGRVSGARAAAKFAGVVDFATGNTSDPAWTRNVRRRLRDKLRGGAAGADVTGNAAVQAAIALDNAVKGANSKVHGGVIDAALPYGLGKQFPANQFSLMVASGAKGSNINHAMIAVGLGQQELEGRRVPFMASGKTLPCFPAFDPAPRAGGYIADRFLTGLRPAEYFFHCMSGREGLVDTAVKTSRSGYLQRCLVKHLESLRVHYDYSVRDADGCMVQACYGEDGMDILNTPYLQGSESQLAFLGKNYGALSHQYGMTHKTFRETAQSFANNGSELALASHVSILRLGRELVGPTAPTALATEVLLKTGTQVHVRLPSRQALGLPSMDAVLTLTEALGGDLTVDGRAVFTPAHLAAAALNGQPLFVPGRIVKVRGEAGSAEPVEYDVRFSVAVARARPAGAPRVLSKAKAGKGKVSKGEGKKKGKKKKAADSDEETEDEEMEVAEEAPVPQDEAGTSSYGNSTVSGVTYEEVRVLAKRVRMIVATGKGDKGLVVLRPALPDPIMSTMRPSTTLGVFGEALRDKVEAFVRTNPGGMLRLPPGVTAGGAGGKPLPPGVAPTLSGVAFKLLMSVKAMRSLVAPGEPVGVIAAQSIGEPSTQMTLNTFHLAGGGGVNVTLGIPRLREIVMTASQKPKTPQMTLPLHAALDMDATKARDIAGRIARLLSPLPLSDLLATSRADGGIRVAEQLRQLGRHAQGGGVEEEQADAGAMWVREYSVRIFLSEPEAIAAAFNLSFTDVAEAAGKTFAPRLLQIINEDLRKADRAATVGVSKVKAGAKGDRPGGADGEGGEGEEDDGAQAVKKGKKAKAVRAARSGAPEGGDDDDDDDDGDGIDENEGAEGGDADGTLTVGTKKTDRDYGEEEEEEEDDDAGSVSSKSSGSTSSSSSSSRSGSSSSASSAASASGSEGKPEEAAEEESDSDDGFVRRPKGKKSALAKKLAKAKAKAKADKAMAAAAGKAGKGGKGSKPSSAKPGKGKKGVTFAGDDADGGSDGGGGAVKIKTKKGRLTMKRAVADRAARLHAPSTLSPDEVASAYKDDVSRGAAPEGTFTVGVPEALTRNPRFGGILACPTGVAPGMAAAESAPWIEVTIIFPASARKVLMLSSAERASSTAMVRQVAGITRALVTRQKINQVERTCVMTEGQAIHSVWRLSAQTVLGGLLSPAEHAAWSAPPRPATTTAAAGGGGSGKAVDPPAVPSSPLQPVLDVGRLGTNDIAAVLRTYGVEGCRASLVRELRSVFDAYGIGVDIRHLYLIGDYMTQHGGFRPMNRAGIDGHASPFLKMSFETTSSFLTAALLRGEHDNMTSPSARISLGRPVDAGTGAFSLWTDMRMAAGLV